MYKRNHFRPERAPQFNIDAIDEGKDGLKNLQPVKHRSPVFTNRPDKRQADRAHYIIQEFCYTGYIVVDQVNPHFEKIEPLRWLPFCNARTVAMVNDQTIHSLTTATGLETYPGGVTEELRARFAQVTMVPGREIAKELGNPRVVNVLLLGLLARALPFPKELWQATLAARLPEKIRAVNEAAFERGWVFGD